MLQAERDELLGDIPPPFAPERTPPPPPVPPHEAVFENAIDWIDQHRLSMLAGLSVLIVGAIFLAYRSQPLDEIDAAERSAAAVVDADDDQDPSTDQATGALAAGSSTTATTESESSTTTERSTSLTRLTTATTPRSTATTDRTATTRRTTTTSATTSPTTTPTTATPTTSAPTTTTTEQPTTTTARPTTTQPPTTTTTERPTTTLPVPGPNELANASFERPLVDDGAFRIVAPVGWSVTGGNQMEVWGRNHQGIGPDQGRQFAELNVSNPTTISQVIEVVPGATYQWEFAHRGRTDRDTVEVLIDGTNVARISTDPGSWNQADGTFVVGDNSSTITFALRAVDSGSSGNLVDDVRLRRIANP